MSRTSGSSRRVVVIGGGIIGTACAHYLSKANCQVTIIDRCAFGAGCSHGNCGFVCPSHVLPLAGPGAVRTTLQALFQSNSPFSIKPRFDPALWTWLLRFAARCNRRDMLQAARPIHALLRSSVKLYCELFDSEQLDCEWERRGLLHAFATRRAMEEYAKIDRLLRDLFDLRAVRYDPRELVAFEPALKTGLAGGWYYQEDAHLRPDKLLTAWRRLLEARGVMICEHCSLEQFIRAGNRASAVKTSAGEFSADAFIVATGALTPLLNRELGCRIPIQPGKGYSITMPRPAKCPSTPLVLPEDRVAVTPMRSGYRLGSTMEFAGYDTSLNRQRLGLLKEAARRYLDEPYCEPVLEEWYGWRPMTCDSMPFIGHLPSMENVFLAAGHNMLGLSMAPATGKLIAELVGRSSPHIDPAPFRLRRT